MDSTDRTTPPFESTEPIHRLVTNYGCIYDVYWDTLTGAVYITGLPWSVGDAGETVHIGVASSARDAVQAAEAAAFERLSLVDKYVGGTTLGKSQVIAVHLLVEHLLIRILYSVLPNPDALFRSRTPSFSQLISLCEAHAVVSSDLADVLRNVNSLRNKCAHKLVFHPSDIELRQLTGRLLKLASGDSGVPGELLDPWPILCSLLEKRAKDLGATKL